MTMTLEELIRDMASRGQITHLSVIPDSTGWRAVFCAASVTSGYTTAHDKDPVEAMRKAIVETKIRKRAAVPTVPDVIPTTPIMSPSDVTATVNAPEPGGEGVFYELGEPENPTLEDFLPKVQPR